MQTQAAGRDLDLSQIIRPGAGQAFHLLRRPGLPPAAPGTSAPAGDHDAAATAVIARLDGGATLTLLLRALFCLFQEETNRTGSMVNRSATDKRVVLCMAADPEPNDTIDGINAQRAKAKPSPDGSVTSDVFEVQRMMVRVVLSSA